MWILFVAVGAVLLCVLAYGWGLTKGSELTRTSQAQLHDAVRAAAAAVAQAHERERTAWQAAEVATQSWLLSKTGNRAGLLEARQQRDEASEAAEAAHDATRDALETLRAALVDPSQPGDALELARRRTERRSEEAAQRRTARELRNSVEDDELNRLLS